MALLTSTLTWSRTFASRLLLLTGSRTWEKSKTKRTRQKQDLGQTDALLSAEENVAVVHINAPKIENRKVPTHIAILQDSVYHLGISPISRPVVSTYVPTAINMFTMLYYTSDQLAENPHLHERLPEFFSPALNLYYSHAVYFQILRARAAAGSVVLTRTEKRIIINYERIAPTESWPIAVPLIGFVALGAYRPSDPYYSSWVVPTFPDLSKFGEGNGLKDLHPVTRMLRLPLVPAYQKLGYMYANSLTCYHDGALTPSSDQPFVGIHPNADVDAVHCLTLNTCWNLPSEASQDYANIKTTVKQKRLRRQGIPDVPNNNTLKTTERFLGFDSGTSFDWMKHCLLWQGLRTSFALIRPTSPPSHPPRLWVDLTVDFYGFSKTDRGMADAKLGVATATNAEFSDGYFPKGVSNANSSRSGPFFAAPFLSEGADEADLARSYPISPSKNFDHTVYKSVIH
ncbi:hypothetical protein GGTG_08246 [Gaeumannomyces tritici R3-111a-1]|uniref:Capsid protein n=1 Tax=Gaeumannomyces tritici (strain R3-111a-1) TaxID=644352 RepID=J3P409_GAET3|nr:hypothetical protein GGTG_08246 [Gaeumannomyces tritici R3-111a-1]EJT74405.1 hypothetical protein GGTG_08246 [Gaeumannomyces tritici R3-111a-1]